jgi:phosphomannomutase/phosphoglucomutase
MKVFGSSGIRGVVNQELKPEFVMQVGMAAGSLWRSKGVDRVGVAHDTRTTRDMFEYAATSGLTSVGLDVDRLGTVPTPGVQAFAEDEGIPAVMVTASHNPPEHNGIKLIGPGGTELARETLEQVESRLLAETFDRADWDEIGQTRKVDGVRDQYIEDLLEAVDQETIAAADLTVAVDPGHGAGSLVTPRFFRKLGCKVLTINAQPDGNFPGRNPEPVEPNLGDLGRLVRTSEADFGVAHDGDADRAIFYDENGEYIEGDATLAALAAAELSDGDAVVSAVSASQRLVDVAEDTGADLHLTPIGSTHIVTRIEKLAAEGQSVPIAGEGNGGVIFPEYRTVRDGAYTAARFCELLAERPASEIAQLYDHYHNVRFNANYETDAEREAMVEAIERVATDSVADLDTTDGYRLNYGDGWVLARPSGTEPLIRIYAEAHSKQRANELASLMRDAVTDARDAA